LENADQLMLAASCSAADAIFFALRFSLARIGRAD
jgi:hypothetical protein